MPRSRIGIFRDERTRSTPYDPKLMFWCVSYYLGAFGTVRMPYETRGKTGRTCKSSCHEVASEFFTTNPLDPLHWSYTHVLVSLVPFRYFCDHLVALRNSGKTFRTSAIVRATKSRRNFRQRKHPIHPHWTLNSCFGAFRTIWMHLGPLCCLTKLGAKWAECAKVRATKLRKYFSR